MNKRVLIRLNIASKLFNKTVIKMTLLHSNQWGKMKKIEQIFKNKFKKQTKKGYYNLNLKSRSIIRVLTIANQLLLNSKRLFKKKHLMTNLQMQFKIKIVLVTIISTKIKELILNRS